MLSGDVMQWAHVLVSLARRGVGEGAGAGSAFSCGRALDAWLILMVARNVKDGDFRGYFYLFVFCGIGVACDARDTKTKRGAY